MDGFLQHLLPIILVVLFFGGSILIHELGHYIVAKKRKLFVPKFSIGFGPKICGFKINETEFIISLFPIGGYVAIPQLADLKTIEGDYGLAKNLQPASHYDKISVAVAGPLANLLFAIFLAIILYYVGLPTSEESLTTRVGYVPKTLVDDNGNEVLSPAYKANILPNDKILSVDNLSVERFDEIVQFVALGSQKNKDYDLPVSIIKVERSNNIFDIPVYPEISSFSGQKYDKIRRLGIYPKQTLIIDSFYSDKALDKVGLQSGDMIIAADDVPVFHTMALRDIANSSSTVALTVERNGQNLIREVPVLKLATTKPFISVKSLSNGYIIDIIPQIDFAKKNINVEEDKFDTFEIFCSNKKFFKKSGISNGDKLISLNNKAFSSLSELEKFLHKNSIVSFKIAGKNGIRELIVSDLGDIELHDAIFSNFLGIIFSDRLVTDHISPIKQIKNTIIATFKTLQSLFSKNSNISAQHLMGPAGLMKTLHIFAKTSFPWLLWFVILVNINLAILNLLPFPVLDGGIIVISLMEKLTGWKCFEKIFSKIQGIFVAALLVLVLYVTFFDIRRIWTETHETFQQQRKSRIAIYYTP